MVQVAHLSGFNVKILENKQVAVSEVIRRTGATGQVKGKVTFCLASDFSLVTPHLLINDTFVPIDVVADKYGMDAQSFLRRRDVWESTLYYPIERCTYVANVVVSSSGDSPRFTLNMFLPCDIDVDGKKLISKDVTSSFGSMWRNNIIDSLGGFITARLVAQ